MIEDLLIPLIVVLLMVAAGTGVRPDQFAIVLKAPAVLVAVTVAQVLLLPLVALALIWLSAPAPALAAGLVLVAACPGGALSNFYCYLGRLNVSLSVTLTILSTMASFAVLPLVLMLVLPMIGTAGGIAIPVGEMTERLVLFLLLPLAAGMLVRHVAPRQVDGLAGPLRVAGLVLLVALIGLIVLDQWHTVSATYRESVALGIGFTLASAATGWLVGLVLRVAAGDRRVFAIEFAIRNLGAAALVASATLGRPEFLAFGALFVLVQFPLVLLLLRLRGAHGRLPAG